MEIIKGGDQTFSDKVRPIIQKLSDTTRSTQERLEVCDELSLKWHDEYRDFLNELSLVVTYLQRTGMARTKSAVALVDPYRTHLLQLQNQVAGLRSSLTQESLGKFVEYVAEVQTLKTDTWHFFRDFDQDAFDELVRSEYELPEGASPRYYERNLDECHDAFVQVAETVRQTCEGILREQTSST